MKATVMVLIIGLVVAGLGCGGGGLPAAPDSIVGEWQMYACQNYATGEKVSAGDLGLSGEIEFRGNHNWTSWREGWPGGHVESAGHWVVISSGTYEIKRGYPFPNAYRVGDELYTIGGFGPDLYRFWYRRQ